jgi:Na+/proline symporter
MTPASALLNWWEKLAVRGIFSDTNYIFLSFVTRYLPVGLVGLVIAVILAATMSASSGGINSLSTVTVVDDYAATFAAGAATIIIWWPRVLPPCFGAYTQWRLPVGATIWGG